MHTRDLHIGHLEKALEQLSERLPTVIGTALARTLVSDVLKTTAQGDEASIKRLMAVYTTIQGYQVGASPTDLTEARKQIRAELRERREEYAKREQQGSELAV